MTDYTRTTNFFGAKDGLTTGNPEKVIKGSEFDTEFNAISSAVNSKADIASPTFTGTVTIPTVAITSISIGGTAITATGTELNILDGVTATTAEINKLDGYTGNVDGLNYAHDLRATGVSVAELNKLNGVTATTAEFNILDGVTATTAEINFLSGVTSNIQDQIDNAGGGGVTITGAASTIDTEDLTANRAVISNAQGKIAVSGVTTTELNTLDGITSTTAELNVLDGITATTSELNKLDGVTSTTAELNILDGVTSTATELNLVDGATAGTVVNNKAVVYSAVGQVKATTVSLGSWIIKVDTNELVFEYNGTDVFKVGTNGAVTSANDITAFGTV